MIRVLALLTGSLIIAAVCYAGVVASGGIWAVGAPLQIALAMGLVVGSVAISRALSTRRIGLSLFLALTLIAGEGWALVGTAERTIATRDAVAAPARDTEAARAVANQRVVTAEVAKRAADAAVVSEAAKPGCKKECATLLRENAATADDELTNARRDRAALAPTRSQAPLADRLGYQGWQIDLLVAALASIAANGLAVALIVFAAHVPHQTPVRRLMTTLDIVREVREVEVLPALPPPLSPREHTAQFALARMKPDAQGRVATGELERAYHEWCHATNAAPLPASDLAQAFAELIRSASGLRVEHTEREPVIVGARLV